MWSTLSIEKLKYLPKYLKDLPISTVGTTAWFINSLGRYRVDEVEDFLIQNVEHLSTLITMLAQVHHLVK